MGKWVWTLLLVASVYLIWTSAPVQSAWRGRGGANAPAKLGGAYSRYDGTSPWLKETESGPSAAGAGGFYAPMTGRRN